MHKPQPKYGWWGPEGKTATIAIAPTPGTPRTIYDLDWDESSYIPIERNRDWVIEDNPHEGITPLENYRDFSLESLRSESPVSAWVQQALAAMEATGARRALPSSKPGEMRVVFSDHYASHAQQDTVFVGSPAT